jgi:hypothetical protein
LVAGLSSPDERLLGFDDSIRWNIVNGMKLGGSLTTTDSNAEARTFAIIGEIPTSRDSIHGRATTCWRVRDPESSEELVIKDSWRPEHFPPEHELLALVKGIPGVVDMISHESGRWETKDFRCTTTTGQYENRVSSRVALKPYGKPLVFFTTVLQVLSALRDAIAGAHPREYRPSLFLLLCNLQGTNSLSAMRYGFYIGISHTTTSSLAGMALRQANEVSSSTWIWLSGPQTRSHG